MKSYLGHIIGKKSKLVIGLLSGTSVDGIDAVLVKITGNGTNTRVKIIDFITHAIPENVRTAVLKNSSNRTARLEQICRLNVILGALFSDAALRLLKRNRLNARQADLIGSHGQTIHHLPWLEDYLGYTIKSTLQIADPAIIANLTGIMTVGDFRVADCAVGGEGAPLVPYMDYILFRSRSESKALLNLGGIANITVIPKNSKKDDVIAFDTGPGNMIIDGLAQTMFKIKYDKNGRMAMKGSIVPELFQFLLKDKYYQKAPPKSTGREHYGQDFLKSFLGKAARSKRNDIIRTAAEFTAYSVWFNYKNFVKDKVKIDELIVSGGGAENPVVMNSLKKYFKDIKVRKMNDFGITTSNKEAVLFALLANECISGNTANMKTVTGSTRDVVLGKISIGKEMRKSNSKSG